MGAKEQNLFEAIKNADLSTAFKILNKNTSTIKQNKAQDSRDTRNQSQYQTLKSKINVNYQNDQGMSCLHQACISGNLELVKLLIDCGSQIDLKDSNGYTALHYACQSQKYDLVSYFLRYGINPNDSTYKNETPLHLIIQYATNLNNTALETCILQLLTNGAYFSLASLNKNEQTPFELACELGKFKIVETILKFCSNSSSDKLTLLRSYSKNSLILSSKNAHDDIIRLLLMHKIVDLNYSNSDGTALHEACRQGRLQTVKLLLESGLDQNIKNTSNQLAIDCVIKQKIGNDIKCLLKEYSQSCKALTLKPYLNNHAGALNFDINEVITVLEKSNQNWRGFILDKASYTTRSGYFPSSYVQLIQNEKELDLFAYNSPSRPIITSSTNSLLKLTDTDEKISQTKAQNLSPSSSSSISSSSSSSYSTRRRVNFNDLALETSSLDTNDTTENLIYSSGSFKLNPSKTKNVGEMLRSGLSDSQIIFNWLKEFNMEEYYENFVKSGYDLITIMKCCPADLCAIGISDPVHRQLIKQAISQLDISEIETKLNQYLLKINSLEELLKLIHLEQYLPVLKQVYGNFAEFVNTLSWEDLEESGVKKLGHQKKLIFVTKKLKEILSLRENNLAKSLENIQPTPPKRIPDIQTKQHPPLPPRVSSVLLPKDLISSYATLPRNTKKSLPINFLNEQSSSSTSPPSSSSSPSSTSPTNQKFIDINSILVPPTPPPMPLMSIPTTISTKKSPRRALILNSDACLEESYRKINNSNLKLSSVLNSRPIAQGLSMVKQQQQQQLNKSNDKAILNDIDSMLCDLNKQLDAMLDYEKVFQK